MTILDSGNKLATYKTLTAAPAIPVGSSVSTSDVRKKDFTLIPAETIPAEDMTHYSLFQGVSEVEVMLVREDYRDYLERQLKKVNKISLENFGVAIEATSKDIIEELQFWKVPNFIWPNILQNNDGGLVFVWSVYYDNIRFERSKEGYYSIRVWNTDRSINNGKRIKTNDPSILGILLPIVYTKMIESLDGKDWKSLLDPEYKK